MQQLAESVEGWLMSTSQYTVDESNETYDGDEGAVDISFGKEDEGVNEVEKCVRASRHAVAQLAQNRGRHGD